ncbi:uncharacterized protein PHACADRAFT_90692 [Phanerochaete carnosa HHB-10118-sp]|uniref:Checkpoint protein n=1 Tax=Phanerochaete carnosa (strain HHB-10118-sp) TaxID=650164 RepID=K5WFL9_PHACS|nr:uncharacterized protein PHACADRAFT_90692 [Phanerochaete carnosa HHB-10118-sp]EKM57854.1 hypothetical protein PHACADRAFT_90692 [Phanerochaete carnosa HHB-10118-sp]
MRFRTTIDNVAGFYRVVQAISQLQKKFVVKFTETEMGIICASEVNEGGIQVWTSIKVSSLFMDYRIQSNANNQISMSMSAEALLTTLRSAHFHTSCRLAKKNDRAVLSFEIIGQSRNNRNIRVTQDVRIEVMKPQDVARLSEPLCPEPDVHIAFPPLNKLRTVMDRLKTQSDVVGIRANRSGRLEIVVRTDNVSTEVCWQGLPNPNFGREHGTQVSEAEEKDVQRMHGVLISVKSFMKFLQSHVVCTTTIACICQSHCLILYVYVGEATDSGGVLTFYIPAIMDDAP